MDTPDDELDVTMVEHDGACHDDCPHFQAQLRSLITEATEPRLVITVNRLGLIEYASALPPTEAAPMLRRLADAVERRATRRVSSYLN